MLVSLSKIFDLFIFSAVNIQFWKISISDLIGSPRGEDDYVVIIVWIGLLLLQILLSFFCVNIQPQFVIIVVSNPGLWFDFRMYFFDELFSLFKSDVRFFIIREGFLLSDLLLSQSFSFLWAWLSIIGSGLLVFIFFLGTVSFNHGRFKLRPFSFIICYIDIKPVYSI